MRALFSMPESGDRAKISHMARDYIEGPGRPNLIDGFSKSESSFAFANGGRARFQKSWRAAIDHVISQRKASPATAGDRDLLDLLLTITDAETGQPLSDAEIRDQCATMLFAGSETTARLMFWASYLLTMDPEEQASVHRETIAFPPGRINSLDDFQNWPRLRNVLLEALRLYPPVPQIVRVANGPDHISGEQISANTQVWISPWVMQRHRKFWDRPTAFFPARFTGKTAPWTQTPAYIPFGTAHLHRPSVCIVGSPDCHGAAAFTLRDQSAGCAAGFARRPRDHRAVLRTLVSAAPRVRLQPQEPQGSRRAAVLVVKI